MKSSRSVVVSMRLPPESGKRLKRMANRHGWTASDASARLVEEGLRRSEFSFIDFRDSPVGTPGLHPRQFAGGLGSHGRGAKLQERCRGDSQTFCMAGIESPGGLELR